MFSTRSMYALFLIIAIFCCNQILAFQYPERDLPPDFQETAFPPQHLTPGGLTLLAPAAGGPIALPETVLDELCVAYHGEIKASSLTWQTDDGRRGNASLQERLPDGRQIWLAADIPLQSGPNTIRVEARGPHGMISSLSLPVLCSNEVVETPELDLLAPRQVITNQQAIYQASVIAGSYELGRVEWYFDHEVPFTQWLREGQSDAAVFHAFTEPGIYPVVAKLFDVRGFHTERTHYVRVVTPNHPPVIEHIEVSNDTPEVGEEVVFQATAGDPDDDPLTFTWLIHRSGEQVYHRWTRSSRIAYAFREPGRYELTLIVTDGDRLTTTSLELNVSESFYPTIILDPNFWDLVLCRGWTGDYGLQVSVANQTDGILNYATQVIYQDEAAVPWLQIQHGAEGTLVYGDDPTVVEIGLQDTHQLQGGSTYRANVVFYDIAGNAPDVSVQVVLSITSLTCRQ
ncbi:MAG: PKD domain-containing protein [Acidobacteriota bacterium]|nr:PKD domain-containing protein [Acidobacteriota bacterium]